MRCKWVAVFVCCAAGLACQGNATTAPESQKPRATITDPSGALATVNGEPISAADVVQVFDYQATKGALDEVIADRLIEAAAAKEGMSAEAYLQKQLKDKIKPPTEEEMRKFYDQRKSQIGNKSYEEVKEQIRQALAQGRKGGAQQELLGQLRASADVKIHLEPPRMKVEAGDNPARGPKDAPVQIVEWTDYQCPFCGRSRPTVNQILTTYGDKVRYVIRDFPLSFHQNAFKSHEAAHCASEQGKYWEMNAKMFENSQALEVAKLKEYARTIGVNGEKFDRCVDSGKYKAKVQKNMDAGAAVGVTGTPSFFVNGINVSGARPFADFKELIDAELSKK